MGGEFGRLSTAPKESIKKSPRMDLTDLADVAPWVC